MIEQNRKEQKRIEWSRVEQSRVEQSRVEQNRMEQDMLRQNGYGQNRIVEIRVIEGLQMDSNNLKRRYMITKIAEIKSLQYSKFSDSAHIKFTAA